MAGRGRSGDTPFSARLLAEALRKRGITQAAAAEAGGVSRSQFCRYLSGQYRMPADVVHRVLEKFAIPPQEIAPSAEGGSSTAPAGTHSPTDDIVLTFFSDWEHGGPVWRWTVAEVGRIYDLCDSDRWNEFSGLIVEILRQLKSLSDAAARGLYVLLADARREELESVLSSFDREERAGVTLAAIILTRPAVAFRARLVTAKVRDDSGYHAASGFQNAMAFLAPRLFGAFPAVDAPGHGGAPGQ